VTAIRNKLVVGVLTTGRQDWGILRSTCKRLQHHDVLDLRLLAGGMHCSARHGRTLEHIEADGFTPSAVLDWIGPGSAPSVADESGRALAAIGGALQEQRVGALMLVGDRYETAAAALAATVCRVPLIHLHGGEETEGAFDNALRHAITKMSHLHLVSHRTYAERVVSMGEPPDTVHVVGAPGLDNLRRDDLPGREALERHLGIPLAPPVVVVTLHPTTLALDPDAEVSGLCAALDRVDATYVITLPNSDPGNATIRSEMLAAVRSRADRRIAVEALGEARFWGLLKCADAMVGNSSSALIEAPALGLPAVNIGPRQGGRLRAANLIDVSADPESIVNGLRTALGPDFRSRASVQDPPFGDGRAAERIDRILSAWTPPMPPIKRLWRPE
jgi:UDP-hydrolysing UDP-N-acetyl-D-glucosamine 2-epimerase